MPGSFLVLVASAGALASASLATSPPGERDLRCQVAADAPVFSIVPNAQISLDQKVVPFDHGAALPRLMVEGWKPQRGPLLKVLGELAGAAKLAVVGADGLGDVSWTKSKASFEETVGDLAGQVGAEWSFDGKTISIVRNPARLADVAISTPRNREIALAWLDASKGISSALKASSGSPFPTIAGRVPASEVSKIRMGLDGWKEVQVFDVSLYSLKPNAAFDLSDIGLWTVHGAQGAVRLGFSNYRQDELLAKLKAAGEMKVISAQTVAAPNGAPLALDRSSCSQSSGKIAIDSKKLDDGVSFSVSEGGSVGEISQIMLGQSVMLAGPKGKDGLSSIMILRPRQIVLR